MSENMTYVCMTFFLMLILFSTGSTAQSYLKCRFPYGLDCCDGYYRTSNDSCAACPSGFHGINCSTRCVFPAYGMACLEECRCNESLCNFVFGCPVGKDNRSRWTKNVPDPEQNSKNESGNVFDVNGISECIEDDDFDENSMSSAEEFEDTLIKNPDRKKKAKHKYRRRRRLKKSAARCTKTINKKWEFFSIHSIIFADFYNSLKRGFLQTHLTYGPLCLWLLIFVQVSTANGGQVRVPRYCHESMETIRMVQECPSNAHEFRLAKRRAKCADVMQNCTNPAKFKYHCVLDSKGQLIEVCAVEFSSINGLCIEYNHGGQRLQNNDRICKDCFSNRIMSPKMYQYKDCLQARPLIDRIFIQIKQNSSTLLNTGLKEKRNITNVPVPKDKSARNNTTSQAVISVTVVLPVGVLVAVVYILWKKRKKERRNAPVEELENLN